MGKYRKIPVVIEAIKYDGTNSSEVQKFCNDNCEVKKFYSDNTTTSDSDELIIIHTLEGDMRVSLGDYIIKGIKGEFYPCKGDIFLQTYESVE